MSARAELVWFQGVLHTKGGQVLMFGTLDECAEKFSEVVITVPIQRKGDEQ